MEKKEREKAKLGRGPRNLSGPLGTPRGLPPYSIDSRPQRPEIQGHCQIGAKRSPSHTLYFLKLLLTFKISSK